MSVVRIKNPETNKWEILEIGAATGMATPYSPGVIKYGPGLTLNTDEQLVPDLKENNPIKIDENGKVFIDYGKGITLDSNSKLIANIKENNPIQIDSNGKILLSYGDGLTKNSNNQIVANIKENNPIKTDENGQILLTYSDGITINEDSEIIPDGDLVYFGSEAPEKDFYNLWYDTDEYIDGNRYHPDWNCNDEESSQYIKNKPNFAKVATSGSYSDLKDKPIEQFAMLQGQIDGIKFEIGGFENLDEDLKEPVNNLIKIDNKLNAKIKAEIEERTTKDTELTEKIEEVESKVGEFGHILTVGQKQYNGKEDVEIVAADLGLSSALVFVGIATVEITDGSTTDPQIEGYDFSKAKIGDVIISSDNIKEFVWAPAQGNGNAWELIGPDSGFSPLGHTHTLSEITDWGPASQEKLGGVKVDNDTITIDTDGTIRSASAYELPIAGKETDETPVLGGVIVGNHLDINEQGVLRVNDDVIHIINQSLTFHHFINHENYRIKGGDDFAHSTQICTMTCHIDVLCTPIFLITIPFTMDVDGTVELYFVLNDHVSGQTLKQYCQKGNNVITFMNYWTGILDKDYHVEIYARTYYEETDIRKNNAKLDAIINTLQTATSLPQTISYTIDNTVPTMFIKDSTIRATIFAQGIDEEEPWDGTFWINERLGLNLAEIENDGVEMVQMENVKTTATTYFPEHDVNSYHDNVFSIMDIPSEGVSMDTSHLGETVSVGLSVSNGYIRTKDSSNYTFNREYIDMLDNTFKLQTNYSKESTASAIDEGEMHVLSIDTTIFSSISNIEVKEI